MCLKSVILIELLKKTCRAVELNEFARGAAGL